MKVGEAIHMRHAYVILNEWGSVRTHESFDTVQAAWSKLEEFFGKRLDRDRFSVKRGEIGVTIEEVCETCGQPLGEDK